MANREQASRARLLLLQASLQDDSLDSSKHKVQCFLLYILMQCSLADCIRFLLRVHCYWCIALQQSHAKRRQQRKPISTDDLSSKPTANAELLKESFSWMTTILTCGSNGAGQLGRDA
jgi:hypothetical protein